MPSPPDDPRAPSTGAPGDDTAATDSHHPDTERPGGAGPGSFGGEARQVVADGAPDAAELDVLVRGRATWLERVWLGVRYCYFRVIAQIRELRPGQLNLSWVDDSLAVGGAFSPRDVPRLRELGVTAVLDLRGEATDDAALLAKHGIAFLHLPTPDTYPPSLEHFERGVGWVLEQQAAGRRVFVH